MIRLIVVFILSFSTVAICKDINPEEADGLGLKLNINTLPETYNYSCSQVEMSLPIKIDKLKLEQIKIRAYIFLMENKKMLMSANFDVREDLKEEVYWAHACLPMSLDYVVHIEINYLPENAIFSSGQRYNIKNLREWVKDG